MNVANILPGDIIKVELRYTELLVPTDGIYEFVYPTVVGPRYSNQPAAEAPPSEHWVQNPYLRQGEPPTYSFHLTAKLAAGLPIAEVTCPSHKVNIQYGPSSASLDLDPSESHGGNRDFILKYRLAGGKIQSGLLLYEGEREKFFLLMMQPPKRITAAQIPPREYIFIVDVSGSMYGFPLDISKKLLKDLIGSLRLTDSFNVLLFAGGSSLMSERSLPATPENIARAIQLIESQQGGGGTELLPALKRALSLPKAEGNSRTIVIATDGYVTVEEEAFDLIRSHLGDANLFAFGIGSAVNRHLIEGMARVGMGEPFIITKPQGAPAQAARFRKMIQSPVLTNIKVDFAGFEAYEVEPPSIPEVLAERPVIIFGKWRGRPQGSITLRGFTADRPYREKVEVSAVTPLPANSALRYLWARHRIALLSDYNHLRADDRRVKEVTNLGLTYNLLTAYTSFVAIDTQIRLVDGKPVTVKQPLPLPEGVSDYAVGEAAQASVGIMAKGPLMFAQRPSASPEAKSGNSSLATEEEKLEDKGPASAQVLLRLGEIKATGGLSEAQVRRVLKRQLKSLQLCLQAEGKEGRPHPTGKVVFQFAIDPQGRVCQVSISESKLNNADIEQCLLRKLQQLSFPAPRDGRHVSVTISLILQ
jgi:Ca-activated chloride channel family protein